MYPKFIITYKTSENEMYELTIPNAFDFDVTVAENVTRINTAARAILTQNAIQTGCGNLSSIESIVFSENDVTSYDVSDL